MGDSLMLILRKRPITYLHLIHHVVVVLQVVFTLFNTGKILNFFSVTSNYITNNFITKLNYNESQKFL